jgi:N-glycosylase/DNA lyase
VGLRAFFDAAPVEWSEVALFTAILTVLFGFVLYRLTNQDRLRTTLVLSLFFSAYSFAVVTLGNQVFDRSAPIPKDLRVFEMQGAFGIPWWRRVN